MSWEYAELSKAASKAGGANKYVETLIQSGKHTGRIQMLPFILLAIPIGMKIEDLYSKYKEYRKEKNMEVEVAKKKLIDEINELDSAGGNECRNDVGINGDSIQ